VLRKISNTLEVVVVDLGTGVRRNAGRRAGPTNTATLSPLSNGTCSASRSAGCTSSRGRRSTSTAAGSQVGQTEPRQDVVSSLWDGVTHALSQDSLHVWAERGTGVARYGIVGEIGGRGLRDAEDVGPLLDFFPEVLRVKSGIGSTVPDLEFRTGAGVARITTSHLVALLKEKDRSKNQVDYTGEINDEPIAERS
jgi:hypothetical protein